MLLLEWLRPVVSYVVCFGLVLVACLFSDASDLDGIVQSVQGLCDCFWDLT